MAAKTLRVVILKPSKYGIDGHVERFRRGFMPNGTLPHLASLTPPQLGDSVIETEIIDEYVQTDLQYLSKLRKQADPTLLVLAGIQSHQFQRSIDLAAYALHHGVEHCVLGGPHPMTCDTSMLHHRGVSFALSEAETVWATILQDAIAGELQPVYGEGQRWQRKLDAPVLKAPSPQYLRRYIIPMLGIYPARGCPFTCSFCSVIKIAGREIRSQDIQTTMATLRAAKSAGVKLVLFTSDNFNKYPEARTLLEAMIAERIGLPFIAQCDTQISEQEDLVELMSRAGCFQMFIGIESFNRKILMAAHKTQNHPRSYSNIVRICRKRGITTNFSNIIGFPEDSATGIREHMDTLVELAPDIASFYILTPIPGTQQYDEFLEGGRIYEKNLDRFDGTNPTWHHDTLSPEDLKRRLFECYNRFFSASHFVRLSHRRLKTKSPSGITIGFLQDLGIHAFTRFAALRKMHPMSGGVGRVLLDKSADYRDLRMNRFGFDLLPLPKSLKLSPEETAMNTRIRVS